jgi:hypothetical protein
MEVGMIGGGGKDREHLHGGLHFRIGNQRQVDQALDRDPPLRLRLRLKKRLCGNRSRSRPDQSPLWSQPKRVRFRCGRLFSFSHVPAEIIDRL